MKTFSQFMESDNDSHQIAKQNLETKRSQSFKDPIKFSRDYVKKLRTKSKEFRDSSAKKFDAYREKVKFLKGLHKKGRI